MPPITVEEINLHPTSYHFVRSPFCLGPSEIPTWLYQPQVQTPFIPIFPIGKPPFSPGKPSFSVGKPPFSPGKPSFSVGKPPFLPGKPSFSVGKSPFSPGTSWYLPSPGDPSRLSQAVVAHVQAQEARTGGQKLG